MAHKIAYLSAFSLEEQLASVSWAPRLNFVGTLTSCRSYPKEVIETKGPDHFATKAEFLS